MIDLNQKAVFIVDDSAIVRDRLVTLIAEIPNVTVIGHADIAFEATSPVMRSGQGQTLDEQAQFFTEMGPLVRALVDQPDDVMAKVTEAIKEVIKGHQKDGATELQGKCWIVTAKNP